MAKKKQKGKRKATPKPRVESLFQYWKSVKERVESLQEDPMLTLSDSQELDDLLEMARTSLRSASNAVMAMVAAERRLNRKPGRAETRHMHELAGLEVGRTPEDQVLQPLVLRRKP